jgi:hypothetical protein
MNFALTVGSREAVVNGETVALALPAEIKDGRTFVPLSFVAENLAAVDWDGENGILRMEAASGEGNNPAVPLPEEPVREAYNETVGNTHFHIPAINLPGDDAEKINQEIRDLLYNRVLMSFKDWSEEYDLWVNDTAYRYAVNDSVLSLVISYGQEPEIDFEEYLVYNLDTETGKRLSGEELLEKAGMTQETYALKLRQVLGSGLWAVSDNGAEWLSDAGFNELFNDRLEKTLAEENLRDCRPFLNEKGELCAVARKYSLAGGDYYYGVVNLADFELKPNYDRKAEVPEP